MTQDKAEETVSFTIRMPRALRAYLNAHRFERDRSLNGLVVDLLSIWVTAATDPEDPMFSRTKMGCGLPRLPKEWYEGYRDSLVFTLPAEVYKADEAARKESV